jgi:hypothetical protein
MKNNIAVGCALAVTLAVASYAYATKQNSVANGYNKWIIEGGSCSNVNGTCIASPACTWSQFGQNNCIQATYDTCDDTVSTLASGGGQCARFLICYCSYNNEP